MSEAIAGLVGALIGALAALGAQWLANMHERQAERRRQLVDLLSKHWDVCDQLWRVSMSARYTIEEMQAARQAGHSELIPELDERRRRELGESAARDSEAGFLIAQMRLLKLPVAEKAAELRKSSRFVSIKNSAHLHDAREQALTAYEGAASDLLATS